jgi:hypothetical protein
MVVATNLYTIIKFYDSYIDIDLNETISRMNNAWTAWCIIFRRSLSKQKGPAAEAAVNLDTSLFQRLPQERTKLIG